MRYGARSITWVVAALTLATPALSGCAGMSQAERGAVIGATTGAAVGGVIGRQQGSTAVGAIAGAVIGGAAGAIIGRQMDRQAEELERDLPDARVERVGEGIIVTFESGLLFDFDRSDLRPGVRADLREFAESLRNNPETELLIVGHTDSVGSDSYNQGLSDRRSDSVARYLASQGVSWNRMRTMGRGESEPIASNETDSGRQRNRRVEVAIYASEDYRQEVQRQY
ncbi:MAG: OmpA family protein [Longimicrobiaceae bacterium]